MSETTPPTPTQQPGGDTLDRIFGWLRGLGIRRDTDDRWVSGVSAGLAHRLGVDPIVVRALFVVLACFGGFGITAYLVLWAALPSTTGDILAEKAVRHGDGWAIVLLVVAAFSLFGGPVFAHGDGWWAAGWLVPAAIVAWVVYRLARKEPIVPTGIRSSTSPTSGYGSSGYGATGDPAWSSYGASDGTSAATTGTTYQAAGSGTSYADPTYATPTASGAAGAGSGSGPAYPPPAYPPTGATASPPRPPRPKRRGPGAGVSVLGLGLALVGYGVGYLVQDTVGFSGGPVTLGLITALATLGLFLVVLGVMGRSGGFNGFVATLLAIATAGAVLLPGVRFTDGVGDRTWRPADSASEQTFRLGAGDSTLDLSRLSTDPATPSHISVSQGVGDLTIEVPAGLTAQVSSTVGVGDISLDGRRLASRPASSHDRDSGNRDGSATTVVGDGPVDVYVESSLGLGSTHIRQVS
ncbi:conserved membrane hypothetical protein [Nostocoides japonicum T1-X7]|uniref:Phage shock protein PspC N-terminal domain-containing protein n=1 Tax=Nostocoides japonicum T1-X7 TaxID=1194083 RepID=A0A077LTE3_9MICO|nr:PspC domain-containing protein [Tetrasphaera japonica]CCH76451.1 conserved membrane hypothetical protein [Tetrasphaera japonica T1-X7]